ncbi:AAA family ATPase, partial [Curvibacter gracilis]|uniref:AAA family ATPase n=1 Tax=Curvibacter gracilis TaxID=230310 RepID=UPI0005BA9078
MPRRISRRTLASFEEVPSIVRLWMYRLVLNLQGHRILLTPHGFSNDGVAHALGLSPWVNERREFDAELILQDLRARQAVLERRSARPEAPPAMVRNVQALADLIDLNPVECRVLEFVCLLHSSRVLDDCADLLGMVTHARLADILAELLGLPASGIRWALSPQSQLTQSELVSVNRTGADRLQCKFSLLCNTLSEAIQMPGASVADLFRYVAQPAAPSALSLGDFEHIQAQTSVLIPYLQYCLQKRSTGVNIMIHGLPGVGKTELARLLAHTLGCTLFEVVSQDADGSPQPGQIRLRSLKAAQRIYRKSQALVLFDEAEDVFASDIMTPSVAGKRKAWVNSLLEDAPTPTLWLSNSIDDLDPAFARRFDMIFEMPVPPRSRREQLLAHACGSLVDARTTVRLAQLPHLAPAVAARAASVVRAVGGQLQQHTPTQAFEMLVRNTLQAQGHALPAPAGGTQELPEHYDPAFIHADADLQQVLAGLRQAQSARLCLWGPPGTGKSAYGRWLAQALDRPLVVQRGSDLMSKYVGESEKRIARAFRQAANDGAVLMIDEVDGFLRDRQTVGQSWEVSQVNEMLTQMESYEGVFVASTNLMD